MRILIIKPTALGDVAQALLVVPALKEVYGCDHLAWVVDKDYQPLVEASPWVDEVIAFPRRRWKERLRIGELLSWCRQLRKPRFDIVLDLQGLARSGFMTWVTRAKRRIGLVSAREGSRIAYNEVFNDHQGSAIDRYYQAVEYVLGANLGKKRCLYHLEAFDHIDKELQGGDYLVMHPYSNWQTKLWPWQNYQKLAAELPMQRFVLVGNGPYFHCEARNIIDLRGQTNIFRLMHVLSRAKVVISTDSGPAHVAALYNKPMITLFGATDMTKTAPTITFGKVLQSGKKCQPCLNRRCYEQRPMACMADLTVKAVVKELCGIIEMLENGSFTTNMSQ